ncbi:hypothetical protein E2C01_089145 [Portunus trituberculatus]|uniref:Uncharacterized protein n=1 Tax=Portunus trituberculatus TaxID=210409 RepID=A0A5B7JHC3_PORTR|nr:hypothetical protein [Portunus trituberculatus]
MHITIKETCIGVPTYHIQQEEEEEEEEEEKEKEGEEEEEEKGGRRIKETCIQAATSQTLPTVIHVY